MRSPFRLPALSALLLAASLALPALPASLEPSPEPDPFVWASAASDGSDLDPEKKSAALAVEEIFSGDEQEGLLGFAFDPEFGMGRDHDFVYVAMSGGSGASGRTRIVQYSWDAEAGELGDPLDLAEARTIGPLAHK